MLGLLIVCCSPLISCSGWEPGVDPGNDQAKAWVAQERECPENPQVIDCNGDERRSLEITDSCTTVRNCSFLGGMRIYGPAKSGNDVDPDWARSDSYVAEIRAAAPWGVTIEHCDFKSNGSIPIYVGPGVTFTTIRGVSFSGPSRSVLLYIDAETHGTHVEDCTFDATDAKREAIAVDASDGNKILNSVFIGAGIYAYRNCGEDGVPRHATPDDNLIEGNQFIDADPAIWLGSRDNAYNKVYCLEDADYRSGSGLSNYSHPSGNIIRGNDLGGGAVLLGHTAFGNTIEGNAQ